jgi:hypothetical protein
LDIECVRQAKTIASGTEPASRIATAPWPTRCHTDGDEFHHGGPGLDSRERKVKGPTPRHIYIPPSSVSSIKVTRGISGEQVSPASWPDTAI